MIQRGCSQCEHLFPAWFQFQVNLTQTSNLQLLQIQAPLDPSEVSGQAFVEGCLGLNFDMVECFVNLEIFVNCFANVQTGPAYLGRENQLPNLSLFFFFQIGEDLYNTKLVFLKCVIQ